MATITSGFGFNPFTGTFDITTTDVAVDRLTSTNSTLILSDSGGNQTLTGNLGTLIITPTGEMTVNAQLTAEKFISTYTTAGTAFTTAVFTHNLTLGAGIDSGAYIGADFNLDYNVNNAGGLAFGSVKAINIDIDIANTLSGYNGEQGYFITGTLDYAATVPANQSPVKLVTVANNAATSFSDGSCYLFRVESTGNTGSLVCFRTEAVSSAAGASPIGYEGYASLNSSSTGTAKGVHGLAVSGVATSVLIGVQGDILLPGATPVDRRTAILASSGHMICSSGSLWVTSAGVSYAGAISTTHMTATSSAGAAYIKDLLEVDGTIYGDASGTSIEILGDSKHKADSKRAYFGASDDAYFTYDGTDMKLVTDAVAASDFVVDCGSQKTIELAEVVYNDANIGALVLQTGGTLPGIVEWLDNDGDATGIYTRGWAVGEQGSGSIEIPHDYKEGTDITFHVHWGANDAPSGTDYVKWELIYSVTRFGTTFPDATTIPVETPYDTQYETVRSDFTAITGTNFKIGDQFNFTLKRVAAAGDAFSGEALIETLGFHYACDTLGSRQIGTK